MPKDLEWIKLLLLITVGTPYILGIKSVLIKLIKDKSLEVYLYNNHIGLYTV